MRWTLPNTLTVFRMIAAPCVALVFVAAPRPVADWVALILFVVASLTDYVDGYLARRWRQISAFGTMLDPIADKAVVVIAIATLYGLFGLNLWIVVPATVILLREVFVSGLREFLGAKAGLLKSRALRNTRPSPRWWPWRSCSPTAFRALLPGLDHRHGPPDRDGRPRRRDPRRGRSRLERGRPVLELPCPASRCSGSRRS
jgi:Phosphatidylglycerophosphate synthase